MDACKPQALHCSPEEPNQYICVVVRAAKVIKEAVKTSTIQYIFYTTSFLITHLLFLHAVLHILCQPGWCIFKLIMLRVNYHFAIRELLPLPYFILSSSHWLQFCYFWSPLYSTDPRHYQPSSTTSPAPASSSPVYS